MRRALKDAATTEPCKLEWSDELGRMVLRRDDGAVWDVGFGEFATEKRAEPW